MAKNIKTLVKELSVKFPGKLISIQKEYKKYTTSEKIVVDFSLYIEDVIFKSNIETYEQLLENVIFYLKEE